jgi:hypothetical protein
VRQKRLDINERRLDVGQPVRAKIAEEGDVGIVEPRINLKVNDAFYCLPNIDEEANCASGSLLVVAFKVNGTETIG